MTVLSIIPIALIVITFMLFQSSLKLLSPSELAAFREERLFSSWYLTILFAIFIGILLVEDMRIALGLGIMATVCVVYEHWKNRRSVESLDVSADFKRRMSLIAWLADAIVVIVIVDSVLPFFYEV